MPQDDKRRLCTFEKRGSTPFPEKNRVCTPKISTESPHSHLEASPQMLQVHCMGCTNCWASNLLSDQKYLWGIVRRRTCFSGCFQWCWWIKCMLLCQFGCVWKLGVHMNTVYSPNNNVNGENDAWSSKFSLTRMNLKVIKFGGFCVGFDMICWM